MDRFEAKYPPESFSDSIEKIISFINSGNSCQLVGFPGVGRSNLLGLLAYNREARTLHTGNQKLFHFVLMNFSEMRKKDESEVLKFFFISIIDSLKERSMDEEYKKIQTLFKESLETPDAQVFLQGLKKTVDFLSIEKNLTLILLIDRFEGYVPYLTPNFFTNLRALRNRAKYKFSVVISINRPINELLEPSIYYDFNEFIEENIVYLPLKDQESLNFRIKFLQDLQENEQNAASKAIPLENLNQILELTSGHGKLTRLCIEEYSSNSNEELIESNNLSEFFLSHSKIKNLLLEIWESLTPSEQKYLVTKDKELPIIYLENIGLIQNGKISIPLFETFIKTQENELRKSTEGKFTYDAERHEIKRGEISISETLTSSEFKLLKLMVENPDKIIGREEIVSAVWGNLSSTLGVTEQAIDQLIFRLRKKIEENPNSPIHLQTVKGRGFKFS